MKLSLIIPCYNEQDNVEQMYRVIEDTFLEKSFDLELVYVNDGSRDQTIQKLRSLLEKKDFSIKIVDFSRNFGKESAIYAGLKHATGDYITLIDGDLQQPPALVLEMVDFLEQNKDYDCVAAFQEKRNESALLKFFKKSFYKTINKITNVEFLNGASDFRTFRRNIAETILSMTESNRFTKGIFAWVGFRTHFVPYEAAERTAGTSKWSFRKLLNYAIDGIVSFSTAPLRFVKYAGGASIFAAVAYLLYNLIGKWAFGIRVSVIAPAIFLILLIGGVNLIAMEILGEYVGRIFAEVKKRPIYVAREVLTNEKDSEKNVQID